MGKRFSEAEATEVWQRRQSHDRRLEAVPVCAKDPVA